MICQCQCPYDDANEEIPYLALSLMHHCGSFIGAGQICNKDF
ncbi:hypothetical protein BT93_C0785 [Corymbia citriodora subsp. variegata]|nr:hypothetical protein BT93_C0785 [Corymbia citriodora subsp. variegata]